MSGASSSPRGGCLVASRSTGVAMLAIAVALLVAFWSGGGVGPLLAKAGAVLLMLFGIQALVLSVLLARKSRGQLRPRRPPSTGVR